MKFGVVSSNTASSWPLTELAVEVEGRGFESLWVGEHTHIPTSEISPSPSGAEPRHYAHFMSPFVSLAAAAAVTERIALGTAVCLVLEHDLVDLATQVATLDVISGGRVFLGVGVGWNAEELANHRPGLPFEKRFGAMRERVEALRTIWRDEVAEVSGTWDRLTPSWVNPKPVAGTVPIFMGGWAPLAISHAASYADHWLPIDEYFRQQDGAPDIEGGINRFRQLVEERGRDPQEVGITIMAMSGVDQQVVDEYSRMGVDRILSLVPTDREHALPVLDGLAAVAASFASDQPHERSSR